MIRTLEQTKYLTIIEQGTAALFLFGMMYLLKFFGVAPEVGIPACFIMASSASLVAVTVMGNRLQNRVGNE